LAKKGIERKVYSRLHQLQGERVGNCRKKKKYGGEKRGHLETQANRDEFPLESARIPRGRRDPGEVIAEGKRHVEQQASRQEPQNLAAAVVGCRKRSRSGKTETKMHCGKNKEKKNPAQRDRNSGGGASAKKCTQTRVGDQK